MSTPRSERRSTRLRQSVCYQESPVETNEVKRSTRKSTAHTPKTKHENEDENLTHSRRSRVKKAHSEDKSPVVSPKILRRNRTPSSKALESIVTENSPSMQNFDSPTGSRHSERKRTPNRRLAIYNTDSGSRRKSKKLNNTEDSIEVIEIDESLNESTDDKENVIKPTTLFDEEEDVEGRKLYSFKTPKKKEGMAQLANQTPKTPRHHIPDSTTPRTPKHLRISEIQKTPTSRPSAGKCTKTPRHVRDEIKRKLHKVKYQEVYSDDDFSPDESDYDPNETTSESSESENEEESEDSYHHPPPVAKKQSVAARVLKTPSVAISAAAGLRRSARIKQDVNFVLQSDDYFSNQASKTKTSDHTLDKLKTPRLPHDQLMKLLANMPLSKEHETAIKELNEEHKFQFDKWLTYFDQGFTVLLHGLGSKRNILQAFHKERLANEHVIVVNGFFPSLTIKDVLDSIANDILEMSFTSGNPHEVVNAIEKEMKMQTFRLFIMVHNIDGTMLRNDKAQSILSRLAAVKNIHMIASIDHINAPLLWNNTKLSNFNFVWFDVTSFLPYIDETAFENSFMINNSGSLELSSLRSVFQSLTSNARGIYLLLVKNQLKNESNPNYQGMAFKDLYTGCREAFLVSSDIALRAQLTEFLDHKLAKMKRNIDGAENITIPLKNSLLEKFLSEQN